MNEDIITTIVVIATGLVSILFAFLYSLFREKIREISLKNNIHILSHLEEIIRTLVLKVQKEYIDEAGEVRAQMVIDQAKHVFGHLIEQAGLTDEQLKLIIEKAYEQLRDQNVGSRF